MERVSKEVRSIEPRYRKRLIGGTVCLLLGGVLFFGFESIIGGLLRSQLVISPDGNEFTTMWLKAPLPIALDVFLFHLENPDEFLDGAKPKLKEMGPYSYNLGIYHEIISFNSDHSRFKYWEVNSFDYLPESSPNDLSDKITTVNFPVYALGNMARDLLDKMPFGFAISPVAFGFVNLLFATHGEGLVKTLTVGELLNGYPFGILQTIDTLTKPLAMFGISLPDTGMPENKFGFLWTKNHTRGGPFEAWTGKKPGTRVLDVYAYQGERTLPYYDSPSCNVLAGTEGTILEPMPKPDKVYQVFNMATCKTFQLTYQKGTSFAGIPTFRFGPDPKIFAGPGKNPANKCYCYEKDPDMCDGVFHLSRCLGGAPVAYSFPHFLDAGSKIQSQVIGLSPSEDEHKSFIDVEKHLGSPLQGSEKLQMNGVLRPIPYLLGFRNIRPTVYPLLWMRKVGSAFCLAKLTVCSGQSAALTDDFANKIRMAVYPLYGIYYIGLVLFVLGVYLIATSVRAVYRSHGQLPSKATFEPEHPAKSSFGNPNYARELDPSARSVGRHSHLQHKTAPGHHATGQRPVTPKADVARSVSPPFDSNDELPNYSTQPERQSKRKHRQAPDGSWSPPGSLGAE